MITLSNPFLTAIEQAEDAAWGHLQETRTAAAYDAWYPHALAMRLAGHWNGEEFTRWVWRSKATVAKGHWDVIP